jgi:hypothetical protein
MKNLVLLALCWAMAMSQPFAQKNLPPSAVRNMSELSGSMKSLLTKAGFELSGTEAEKNEVGLRSSALVLDSTLNFYDYGLNGNDSLPLFKSRFSYPNEDVILEVQGQYENGAWQFTNRITSVFDEQERLVDMFAQVYDPSVPTWVGDSRLVIFPHGDSYELIDSTVVYAWNTDIHDWARVMTVNNFFNAQDRLLESHTLIAAFGEPLLFKDFYTYDNAGDNTLIESYYIEPDIEILTEMVELKYKDHLVVSEVNIVSNGVDLIPDTRLTTDYNAFGKPEATVRYLWDITSSSWFKAQNDTLGYDDQQRLAWKETTYHYEGVEDERYRFEYNYIEDELLQLEVSYFWGYQENMFLVDGKKYYYYNGEVSYTPEKPREVAALNIFPNPTTNLARIDLDGETTIHVFDATGHLVASQQQDGRTELDMTALPAGIYMVTALSNNEYYAGRLVKQ